THPSQNGHEVPDHQQVGAEELEGGREQIEDAWRVVRGEVAIRHRPVQDALAQVQEVALVDQVDPVVAGPRIEGENGGNGQQDPPRPAGRPPRTSRRDFDVPDRRRRWRLERLDAPVGGRDDRDAFDLATRRRVVDTHLAASNVAACAAPGPGVDVGLYI